ncbi:hypothetical protein OUZ56_002534 [Daphnia magna]|uniref:Uncharacterized protein n=1 Tax=Daphnia magna TaxID=35525 RepID=A0ABR0A603_9CRUS|nr:hypothetical protein OUZ56_002534 [Daphnia magna]
MPFPEIEHSENMIFIKYQADPTSYDSFTYKCLAFHAATSSLYSRMLCLKLEFSYQRLAKFKYLKVQTLDGVDVRL